MRLLVGVRIYQALNSIRRATTPPLPKKPTPKLIKTADVVAAPAASRKLTSKSRSKSVAAVAAATATSEVSTSKSRISLHKQQLQQLWELNKETREGVEPLVKREVQRLKDGKLTISSEWVWTTVELFSDNLEFTSIEKLLTVNCLCNFEEGKIPNVKLVTEVLWAAVRAKSLGSLAPSILEWIEEAVRRLPEPIPKQKYLITSLLSILRGDLPMLQQLQQESSSNGGRIGPEIERKKTLRHAALTYLDCGKSDEFRSLWTSSGTPLLAEKAQLHGQQSSALLHHALLRKYESGKNDPTMLRWYAESLVSYQRTPIPAEPQFETMMAPAIRALGGRIEKWKYDDWRIQKLRKWRKDYDDAELDKLVHSMLDHVNRHVILEEYGGSRDLKRLGKMLNRLVNEERRGTTVVVDWLNFARKSKPIIDEVFPSCSLIVVGRKAGPPSPKESERVKVINLPPKREKIQELDHFCALLAVATRGHLLTNDMTREYGGSFRRHLEADSRDVFHSTLLKNYLNDATLRHYYGKTQPVVDHSKAAQWIDKEKKELAFTVAREPRSSHLTSFREIEYYSLHID